jgi:Flp pilus assembly protein TadG
MIPMTKLRNTLLRNRNGSAAVEFSLVAPVAVLLLLGIIEFSVTLSTYSALQQIASEAARAGLAGTNGTQQTQFANQYVSGVLPSYGFIDATKVSVSTNATSTTFAVSLNYDASKSFFGGMGPLGPLAPVVMTRSAVVQVGGF